MTAQHAPPGLLRIEECLDADGGVVLPPGVNLLSLIDRNIANVGDSLAYRYLDYTGSDQGHAVELTWRQLGDRLLAIAARLQQLTGRGERVAILAPQGLDYVVGFFAAIKAGTIAVPLFAPELPGHAERLDTALRDAQPTVVLTTASVAAAVTDFLETNSHPHRDRWWWPSTRSRTPTEWVTSRSSSTSMTSHICSTPRVRRGLRWAWRSPTGRWAPT